MLNHDCFPASRRPFSVGWEEVTQIDAVALGYMLHPGSREALVESERDGTRQSEMFVRDGERFINGDKKTERGRREDGKVKRRKK